MPRFAFVQEFLHWPHLLPNAKPEEFQGESYVSLDSLTITEEEWDFLKRNRHPVYCPVCKEEVFFRKKHTRGNQIVHPHWVHKSGKDECFHAEGVAHALTKRFIFGKLEERGYTVKEERTHKIGDRTVRADVAVLEQGQAGDVLKLVVEVQASNTTEAEVRKRMAAYYQEQVPVAWVLLLDSFFERYQIELGHERTEDGQWVERELLPDREYVFGLGGKDHPVFTFLMDHYFYVIGIRHDGKVFLIRRSPHSAREREFALARGQKWTIQEDSFLASLIRDDKIADVLLQTPLIPMEYTPQAKKREKSEPNPSGEFKGDDCLHVPGIRREADEMFIDFEGGRTTGNTLDSLQLIRETMEAARRGREEAERQRREEERRRKEQEERERLEAERRRKEQERREAERLAEWIRKEREWKAALERERKRREEEHRRWVLELEQKRAERERLQQKRAEREAAEHAKKQAEPKRLKLEPGPYIEPDTLTTKEKVELRKLLWEDFLKVPKDQRAKWELERFVDGMPPWFYTKKYQLEKKEHEQLKKQLKPTREKDPEPSTPPVADGEQLTLDLFG